MQRDFELMFACQQGSADPMEYYTAVAHTWTFLTLRKELEC